MPLIDGGCGLRRGGLLKLRQTAAPTIRTTVVKQRRAHAAGIRTTVSGQCVEVATASAFFGNVSASLHHGVCNSSSELVSVDTIRADKEAKNHAMVLAKDAMLSFAPMFIAAPLQLLSPWSGLGGVSMAMMPPPPPGFGGMGGNGGLPPGMKEEEHFMELIFPGWDAGSFVWQITCMQVAQFAMSMVLGHQGANPTPCVLYQLGASWGPAVAQGQLWRLVTPVFLHANLTHLLFNVFFQLRMGFGMEKQFGRNKMMLIYTVCGIFGNLISINMDPFKLAVGASTAGFGLIGVWLAEILLSWEILGPARERTIIWIAFMLVSVTSMSTMTPNMDLWGHLGGALGGFLLSIVISDMKEEDQPSWYGQARAAAAVGMALILVGGLSRVLLVGPRLPIPECAMLPGLSGLASLVQNGIGGLPGAAVASTQ